MTSRPFPLGSTVEVDESWHFAQRTVWTGTVKAHSYHDDGTYAGISTITCTDPPASTFDSGWSWWVVGKGYDREARQLRLITAPGVAAQPSLFTAEST